jgi:hypothetical protein
MCFGSFGRPPNRPLRLEARALALLVMPAVRAPKQAGQTSETSWWIGQCGIFAFCGISDCSFAQIQLAVL